MKKRLLLIPALALLAACSGSVEESAPPEGSLSPVYTDWSMLEPYQPDKGLYTRYYDRPVGRLLAVEGGYGGPLIGFVGSRQGRTEDRGSIAKYGLATVNGTVVCDPVYSSVEVQDGYLILNRSDLLNESGWGTLDRFTVAAPDGSWVLEGEYRRVRSMFDGRLVLTDAAGGVWLCDRNGTLTPSPLNEELARRQEADWKTILERGSFYDGAGVFPEWERSGSWLLNAVTGEVKYLPDVAGVGLWGGDLLAASTGELYGYLDRNGNWAVRPQFQWAGEFRGDCAEVTLEEGGSALIDRSGRVVVHIQGHQYTASDRNGTVYYLDRAWDEGDGTITAIYDSKGRPLPDHPLTGREALPDYCAAITVEDQVIGNLTVKDGLMTLWDYDGTVLGTVEGAQGLTLHSCENGRAVLYRWDPTNGGEGVYDLAAGAWVVPLENYWHVWVETDGTDTVYVGDGKYTDGFDILREDGTFFTRVDTFSGFTQGLLQCTRGDDSVWLDLNGEEVFRWPIQGNSD